MIHKITTFVEKTSSVTSDLRLLTSDSSALMPRLPSLDPAEIRFVFSPESTSQSRLLVQDNEQMSYEKEQAGIDEIDSDS